MGTRPTQGPMSTYTYSNMHIQRGIIIGKSTRECEAIVNLNSSVGSAGFRRVSEVSIETPFALDVKIHNL